jgi:hypothetical protein
MLSRFRSPAVRLGLLAGVLVCTVCGGRARADAAGFISDFGRAPDAMSGLSLVASPTALSAQRAAPDASRWRFSAESAYLYGPVRGFVQTPSGGNPGTTSSERPRFSEIGINDANVADVSGIFGLGNHEIYAGAQFIELSGSRTLSETLVSQGVTFPAGTRVHSDVSLDWYRVGYRYRWVVDGAEAAPVLTLYPSVGAALFTFDYRLRGDGVAERVSRSYTKGLPQLGLELEWRPGGGAFSVSLGAMGFPAIDNIPSIATEHLTASYRILNGRDLRLEGFVGGQFEQIYYKDSQRVSNHVEADLGPMLVVGIGLGF